MICKSCDPKWPGWERREPEYIDGKPSSPLAECSTCLGHGVLCACGGRYVVHGEVTKFYACEKCGKQKEG